mmetsp:Transcript_4208/g.8034  ORF Transcript_4208/g.8034 Transcript_4208/m.8034 type:complete len:106 (-) Transcript_4208:3984-4301(-)|eukprot:CAMPEP_0176505924 /NCGR_PEP_ID=MMETSP0200_2-20121128/16763_1 /TAXON_ID=947934 /ORGANISM="Chaetoceros sp., Strain GSL56" /LENGTH=105 /DNA_ID=CAMNT_0017905529 /DNA_START=91 /DNA_END=408 /DNA_ORIENTATION=-
MENIQNLPKHQQQQLEQHLVNSQVKDSLSMYMNLVERCFDTCVHNFRTKSLDKYESKCLENCSTRYIKTANRVGLRFQEHQALQMKRAQEQMVSAGAAGGGFSGK